MIKTPDNGVQPQAVVDASGVIHLVYLRGEAGGSDVYYASRKPGELAFGPSIRVNSEAGSAIAMGTVRGPRVAIGRGGRIHVAWNGDSEGDPAQSRSSALPLRYARSDEAHSRFEPQRNLMTRTHGLDGGASLAADASGNVYVAWHGQAKGSTGEGNRRVWVDRSSDDGATFSGEEPASLQPSGACGCCGTAALAISRGAVYLLYRAATNGSERDMILLTSRDRGKHFEETRLDSWRLNACPMSTGSLSEGTAGVLAAWETKGQVAFARVDRKTGERAPPTSPTGKDGTRKHPSLATNPRGETLLAWTEGTGWQKGVASSRGRSSTRSGRPLGSERRRLADGVPVWGSAAAIALAGRRVRDHPMIGTSSPRPARIVGERRGGESNDLNHPG